jgi:penicillin-binding protein 1C
MRKRWALTSVRFAAALALFIAVAACVLLVYSSSLALPEVLVRAEAPSLRLYDRSGLLLSRLRGDGDVWRDSLDAGDIGPHTFPVLIAAEDARFWSHPGIDPVAMVRAATQAALAGRIVSGASTITQQLARSCFQRPRNLWGKLQEMALALRIERSLSKQQILIAYLNRVDFGPRVTGMAAASDRYLGKPIGALDLGETALLMATVRGPSVYDLARYLDRAKQRRDRILERAARRGLVPRGQVELAVSTPAVLRPHAPWPGAWHFSRKVAREHAAGRTEITSTVDFNLQRRVEDLARRQQHALSAAGASAVSVIVLGNEGAEVLAYVGSHDAAAAHVLGQNDGASSPRQPGSALKPFLYAAAMDELGLGPTTLLPDEPLTFRTPSGHYAPDNYDRRFRGPVSLTRALASSLNVPAVFVLERLGVARGLTVLRNFGLASLHKDAEHYGLGLALGAGEVTLLELTGAYAALARGGEYLAPRLVQQPTPKAGVQVVSPTAARVVTAILEDDAARTELFGRLDAERLGVAGHFAIKTGTSSGFRDAWAFVYDDELTVGVWVGNFDGRPMVSTSGAGGAAPLALATLAQARATRPASAHALQPADSVPDVAPGPPASWLGEARITFPVDGARLALRRLDRPGELVVRTARAPGGARLLVDGSEVPWVGGQAVITARPGMHNARLEDARGSELSRVTFQVLGPG